MPHVSKRKLDPKIERELNALLEYVLGHLKPEEAKRLLSSLLSDTERLMLAKRIATVFLLEENLPESQIAETLKLTPDTISKISLMLETSKGQGFKVAVSKMKNLERIRLFKKILLDFARYAIRAAGGRPMEKPYYK